MGHSGWQPAATTLWQSLRETDAEFRCGGKGGVATSEAAATNYELHEVVGHERFLSTCNFFHPAAASTLLFVVCEYAAE